MKARVLDGYAGAWCFTTNPEYFSHNAYVPGTQTQSETPWVRPKAILVTMSSLGFGFLSTAILASAAKQV